MSRRCRHHRKKGIIDPDLPKNQDIIPTINAVAEEYGPTSLHRNYGRYFRRRGLKFVVIRYPKMSRNCFALVHLSSTKSFISHDELQLWKRVPTVEQVEEVVTAYLNDLAVREVMGS